MAGKTLHDLADRAQVRALCDEFEQRLTAGESLRVEEFLAGRLAVGDDRETLLDLIYAEFAARLEQQKTSLRAELLARFPSLASVLQAQFEVHELVEGIAADLNDDDTTGSAAIVDGHDSLAMSATALDGYELLAEVGRGATGVVYKARHTKLGRTVAVKTLLAGEFADAEVHKRLAIEARAIARVVHPNVVQLYEAGQRDGLPYLALEYVAGRTLADRLADGPAPPAEAASLVETVARGVHAAHEQGILHRDLKPANILLAPDGQPKITDFGLAKLLSERGVCTATGALLGTPAYMAPEQASGALVAEAPTALSDALGPPTDIYALGAILYELLTGRPPFVAETAWETLRQLEGFEPVPPRRLRPSVPIDLETICLKCLEKKPAQRYATAAALADDLSRFRAGRPITARPVRAHERLWKLARRRPALATLTLSLILVFVTGFLGVVWQWRRAEAQRERTVSGLADAFNAVQELSYVSHERRRPWTVNDRSSIRLVRERMLLHYERVIEQCAGEPRLRAEFASALASGARLHGLLGNNEARVALGRRALDELNLFSERERRAVPNRLTEALAWRVIAIGLNVQDRRLGADEIHRAREILRAVLREAPTHVDAWVQLTIVCGSYDKWEFDVEVQLAAAQEGLAAVERLGGLEPLLPGDLERRAKFLAKQSNCEFELRRWADAMESARRCCDAWRELLQNGEASLSYQQETCQALVQLARLQLRNQQRDAARQSLDLLVPMTQKLIVPLDDGARDQVPPSAQPFDELSDVDESVTLDVVAQTVDLCQAFGETEIAADLALHSIAIADRWTSVHAATPKLRYRLARVRRKLAGTFINAERFEDALEQLRWAEAELELLERERSFSVASELLACEDGLGHAYRALNQLPRALACFQKQETLAAAFLEREESSTDTILRLHAQSLYQQGDVLRKMWRLADAAERYLLACDALRRTHAAQPFDVLTQQQFAEALYFAGDLLWRKDRERAKALLVEAIDEYDDFVDEQRDRDGYRDHLLKARRRLAEQNAP
ncbi:MAG: serine/threonine protein kinase [Pirellulales bacterium]|nr:serine/threonine protein kinase [Pirellulales bacterium]